MEKLTLKDLIARHEAGTLVGAFETTAEDYHAAPGISKTGLDRAHQAPALFKFFRENPETLTKAMEVGQELHTAVLEPEEFSKRYAVLPEDPQILTKDGKPAVSPWATAEGKALIKALSEDGRKLVLKHSDAHEILTAAKVAHEHSRAAVLKGIRELSFWWKDPETGLLCKCRPDVITVSRAPALVDYKSAQAVYPERVWQLQMHRRRYHVQAAFYLDGVLHALAQSGQNTLLPVIPKSFIYFAQEKTAPYLAKPWHLGDSSVALGRREYQADLKAIAECERTKTWPGYPEKIETIELPEYAWDAERDAMEEMLPPDAAAL